MKEIYSIMLIIEEFVLTNLRSTINEKKNVHSYISVQLGESSLDISVDSIGKTVGNWCLEILKSIRKINDMCGMYHMGKDEWKCLNI